MGRAATLTCLILLSGCSFDFERTPVADALAPADVGPDDGQPAEQHPPPDTGLALDAVVADTLADTRVDAMPPDTGVDAMPADSAPPVDANPPPADAPAVGPKLLHIIKDAPAGCPTGTTVVGGGTECHGSTVSTSYPLESLNGWAGSCINVPATNHALCLEATVLTTTIVPYTNPSTTQVSVAQCTSGKAIGGGCACASGSLVRSQSQTPGSWSCACSTTDNHTAYVICLPTADADVLGLEKMPKSSGPASASSTCDPSTHRLVGGGCEGTTAPSAPLTASYPDDGLAAWQCESTGGTVSAWALCISP